MIVCQTRFSTFFENCGLKTLNYLPKVPTASKWQNGNWNTDLCNLKLDHFITPLSDCAPRHLSTWHLPELLACSRDSLMVPYVILSSLFSALFAQSSANHQCRMFLSVAPKPLLNVANPELIIFST